MDELPDRIARTQLTVGIVAVLVGLLGYYVSRDAAFSGGPGAIIFEDIELRTTSYNKLGALLTIGFGTVGIVAGATRMAMIGLLGGIGFGLLALQPLLQWRSGMENLLAATGRNIGWNLALALGLAVPAILARVISGGAGESAT